MIVGLLASVVNVASASDSFVLNGLLYKVKDGNTLEVGKIDDKHKPTGKLVIPARVKYDGTTYQVTAVTGWGFFGCEDITEVEFPSTLERIGSYAFCKCGMKKVVVPESVRQMDYCVFQDCPNLVSAVLPQELDILEEGCFKECSKLTDVVVPKNLTLLPRTMFSDCKSLTEFTIPEGVVTIGDYAFSSCESLTKIVFPSTLKTIKQNAFLDCGFTEIDIPEGVEDLYDNSFGSSKKLERMSWPSTLNWVGGNPFRYSPNVKVSISEQNQSFKVVNDILYTKDGTKLIMAFPGANPGDYVVPKGVKEIGPYAFYNNNGLTSVVLPVGVEAIGACAFHDCRNLKKITLPKGLQEIGDKAFYSCSSLERIDLPKSLERMEGAVFNFCGEMREVTVYESLFNVERCFNNLMFSFCDDSLVIKVLNDKGKVVKTTKVSEMPDFSRFFPHR